MTSGMSCVRTAPAVPCGVTGWVMLSCTAVLGRGWELLPSQASERPEGCVLMMGCMRLVQAKKMLGWEPKVALRDGLAKMVDDFAKRLGVEKPAV